jgi:hypothetical protein
MEIIIGLVKKNTGSAAIERVDSLVAAALLRRSIPSAPSLFFRVELYDRGKVAPCGLSG